MKKLLIAFAFVITAALALTRDETIMKKILIVFSFVTALVRLSSLALTIHPDRPAGVSSLYIDDDLCED